jgi:N-acetylglucosaminyl-diphospho-decaprenol L-rhamnosyltransferase
VNEMIDVLVVNYNTAHLLDEMFSAIESAAAGISVRYLVVDNASSDESVAALKANRRIDVLITNEKNVGFGRANNQLLPHLRGDFVLLLNTDAFVSRESLRESLRFMSEHPECGLHGVRLQGRDGELQPSCRYFPTPLNLFLVRCGLQKLFPALRVVDDMCWSHEEPRVCDWVPGCYYFIRREVVDQLGLFDDRYFLYCEEVDHCKKVQGAGWLVMFNPWTSVVHVGGESAKSVGKLADASKQLSGLQMESELLYFRKHFGGFAVLSHLILMALGDAILFFKDVLRNRGLLAAVRHFKNSRAIWVLAFDTRFGLRPTR